MRYWGLIVLSSFKEEAHTFTEIAQSMATGDNENLVRVRAAEFLGLVHAENPGPFVDALRKTDNTIEAMIILNTIVLLKDFHDYQIEVNPDIFRLSGRRMRNLI